MKLLLSNSHPLVAYSLLSSLMADPATATTDFLSQLQAALQPPTKLASELPAAEDVAFHRSIDKKVAAAYDEESKRMLSSINILAAWAGKSLKAQGKQRAADDDGVDEDDEDDIAFSRISDIVDNLLEGADITMDEYISPKPAAQLSGPLSHMSTSLQSLPRQGKLPANILNAPMDPPQRSFTLQPDNSADKMWDRPLTMGKPNALPRSPSSTPPPASSDSVIVRQGMYCAEGDPQLNPYYYEIFHQPLPTFIYQPPSEEELQPPPQIDAEVPMGTAGVPYKWIDTKEGVEELAQHLEEERVKEIAIDLEAHAYRSYQGIACLMQLSTRWGDYILDLVSDDVRQSIEVLNRAFTHPDKVKILHGAEHDILWLQRDCNLYLVNLFDTYHATNVLGFPGHSLAFLLSKYYDFEADKRYQLADWRLRPMPKEMIYYARSDTHSLIYVYHRLRAELLANGGKVAMDEVFRRSRTTAARRYAKEVWDEEGDSRDGWRSIWSRIGGAEASGTSERRDVNSMGKTERLFRRLHRWRDDVARIEDESPKYILPTMSLLNLASRAPMDKSEALAVLTPGVPAVRKRAGEVARVIKEEVLAWEQAQKVLREKRESELVVGTAAAAEGSDAEDVGMSVDEARAPALASSSAPAVMAPVAPHTPVVESLWSTPTGTPSLRRQTSGLFGSTIRPSEQSSASSPLRDLVSSSLRSILGGGGSQVHASASAAADVTAPAPAPQVVEVEDKAPSASPATGSPEEESDDDAAEVQVKRKKDKKPKWTAEEKRKAREEREAAAGATTDGEPSIKRRKKDDGEGEADSSKVKPFDYSTTTSLLDAPRPPSSSNGAAKKSKKDKKKREASAVETSGPERFANARQPRDRSTLSNGVGKSVTFR